jgi:hypothetical protein
MTDSILSELDWDEGLTIPVANAQNKLLEDEVTLQQCHYCVRLFIEF